MRIRVSKENCRPAFFPRSVALYLVGPSKAILFHPPVECAAAEAQRLRRLAHIAVAASQRLADEDTLNRLQAHLLEAGSGNSWRAQAKIGQRNARGGCHQHRALNGVVQFTDVAGPRITQHRLQSRRLETLYLLAVARGVAAEKVRRQRWDIFAAIAQ